MLGYFKILLLRHPAQNYIIAYADMHPRIIPWIGDPIHLPGRDSWLQDDVVVESSNRALSGAGASAGLGRSRYLRGIPFWFRPLLLCLCFSAQACLDVIILCSLECLNKYPDSSCVGRSWSGSLSLSLSKPKPQNSWIDPMVREDHFGSIATSLFFISVFFFYAGLVLGRKIE